MWNYGNICQFFSYSIQEKNKLEEQTQHMLPRGEKSMSISFRLTGFIERNIKQ